MVGGRGSGGSRGRRCCRSRSRVKVAVASSRGSRSSGSRLRA